MASNTAKIKRSIDSTAERAKDMTDRGSQRLKSAAKTIGKKFRRPENASKNKAVKRLFRNDTDTRFLEETGFLDCLGH